MSDTSEPIDLDLLLSKAEQKREYDRAKARRQRERQAAESPEQIAARKEKQRLYCAARYRANPEATKRKAAASYYAKKETETPEELAARQDKSRLRRS